MPDLKIGARKYRKVFIMMADIDTDTGELKREDVESVTGRKGRRRWRRENGEQIPWCVEMFC